MQVVADSHALFYYLVRAADLPERAVDALGEAEDSDGIVVSAATLGDLWYASHKQGPTALPPGAFELIRSQVRDASLNFVVAPVTEATMDHLASFPLAELKDPWDRMIVATALELRLALVSGDGPIQATGVVPVIWE